MTKSNKKIKRQAHLYINHAIQTKENRPILAEQLKDELNAHTIVMGKNTSMHGHHFYLYLTDEQQKEWKIKIAMRELDAYEPQTTTITLPFDFADKYKREHVINQSMVITLWSDYKKKDYTINSYALAKYLDILTCIAKHFDFAKDTNYNQVFKNGKLLALSDKEMKEQIEAKKKQRMQSS